MESSFVKFFNEKLKKLVNKTASKFRLALDSTFVQFLTTISFSFWPKLCSVLNQFSFSSYAKLRSVLDQSFNQILINVLFSFKLKFCSVFDQNFVQFLTKTSLSFWLKTALKFRSVLKSKVSFGYLKLSLTSLKNLSVTQNRQDKARCWY